MGPFLGQEQSELESVKGSWELADLCGDRTRASYKLEVDLGRSAAHGDPRGRPAACSAPSLTGEQKKAIRSGR